MKRTEVSEFMALIKRNKGTRNTISIDELVTKGLIEVNAIGVLTYSPKLYECALVISRQNASETIKMYSPSLLCKVFLMDFSIDYETGEIIKYNKLYDGELIAWSMSVSGETGRKYQTKLKSLCSYIKYHF